MNDTSRVISVKGPVRQPGQYQAAGDDTLLSVIFRDAGGMANDQFLLKAVLFGGTLGRFLPPQELKETVRQSGEAMVVDEGSCLVNIVRILLNYNLTCRPDYKGCAACRAAMADAIQCLDRLSAADGSPADVSRLQTLAGAADATCPDGCSALNPLRSALDLYLPEFTKHAAGNCPASICGELMLSPCNNSCPANVDLAGTIALMQMGKYHEALILGRSSNPLFLTCGFVCEEPPCQKNCKRLTFDEPVYSQGMHRYAGEKAAEKMGTLSKALQHPVIRPGAPTGKKVAIVGGGPAGLSAAYFLARLGHETVIYEKNDVAGGMTSRGIPGYRVDRNIVAEEIAAIESLGVKIITGCAVGRDVAMDDLRRDYDAVLLTIGAWRSRPLGIPGEDLPGVIRAVDYLDEVAASGTAKTGNRVVVIGGGNVAIDAARTAVRLGAGSVKMFCVEDKFEMPATRHEIHAAEEEGISIHGLTMPLSIAETTGSIKLAYSAVIPGPYDTIGRRWPPQPRNGSTAEVECDMVIVAIGQMPDSSGLGNDLTRRGPFVVADNYATNLAGVFAAGDCTIPVNTVIKAIRDGREAAFAIDLHLTGAKHTVGNEIRKELGCFTGAYECQRAPQVIKDEQPVAERIRNFDLVECSLTAEKANYEMLRCVCAAKGAL